MNQTTPPEGGGSESKGSREPFGFGVPLEDVEDLHLIRAAQAGDSLAMSRLLDGLAPYVGRICGAIALDDGPDAAQEALLQVFRDLNGLREPAALRGWARRIAVREGVRHARRDHRRQGLVGIEDTSSDPGPFAEGRSEDVRRVLQSLEPEQRAILLLRDLEGYSEEEAARELGVAKGTVKSRLHRARQAFRLRWSP